MAVNRNGFATTLRQDLKVNRGYPQARFIVTYFRIVSFLRDRKECRPVFILLAIGYKIAVEWILSVEIPISTKVGAGLRLPHPSSIVINPDCVIGAECTIRQNVTLGKQRDGQDEGVPWLGNGVSVGSGAQVLGGVKVGDRAFIGAGAVVLSDVPSGARAVGVPARILPDETGARDHY